MMRYDPVAQEALANPQGWVLLALLLTALLLVTVLIVFLALTIAGRRRIVDTR